MQKTLVARQHMPEIHHSDHFRTIGARSSPALDLDPFLNIDLFHMSQPTFAPHPHAGFSAVTYMLPESPGAFRNRDSAGDRSVIGPGALHWAQAGAGLVHEESPDVAGEDCWGFQIFVNMAAADKQLAPRAFRVDSTDIPTLSAAGSTVRVLAGAQGGLSSRLTELSISVELYDISLDPDAAVTLTFGEGQSIWGFGISGAGHIGDLGGEPAAIDDHHIALFSQDGTSLSLRAGDRGLRALVGGGRPLRQPVVWGGPFSMTSEEEVRAAYARYERGEMGTLAAEPRP